MDPIMLRKISVGMFLIILIYFNANFKVTCKDDDSECRFIKTYFKEKCLKFVLFQSQSCFFHQNSLTNLQPCVVWSLPFVMKPSNAFHNG